MRPRIILIGVAILLVLLLTSFNPPLTFSPGPNAFTQTAAVRKLPTIETGTIRQP
jgi:hypothetical protein